MWQTVRNKAMIDLSNVELSLNDIQDMVKGERKHKSPHGDLIGCDFDVEAVAGGEYQGLEGTF